MGVLWRAAVFGAVCGVLYGQSSLAQQLPGPAQPERVIPPLQPPPEPLSREAPLVTPPPPGQRAPSGAEAVRFTLRSVQIVGSTVYPADAFQPIYQNLIGKTVSIAEIYQVSDAITAKYRNDGYLLSQAVVPAQRIIGGTVRIEIVEGFVDQVVVQGDVIHDRNGQIAGMARRIRAERPLRAATLERYLLLINDLPGITATSVFQPSANVQGAADLQVNVERKALDVTAGIDNRGSKFIGPYQFNTGVALNGAFGFNERLSAQFITTPFDFDELLYGQGGLELPLGLEGLKLQVLGAYSRSEPGYTLERSGIRSETSDVSVGLTYPFLRSRSRNLTAGARFEVRSTNTDSNRVGVDVEDKLRVLRANLNYDFVDTWAGRSVNLLSAEWSQGLDIAGATGRGPRRSRPEAKPNFTKFNFYASRQQPVMGKVSMAFAATAQYALDPLLSAEEFGLGGAQFLRAYDPSEALGDHCLAGSIELQYTDQAQSPVLLQYQLYGFFDAGKVWNRNPRAGVPQSSDLKSTGFGSRFVLTQNAAAQVELAFPLDRAPLTRGDKDPRVFFGVNFGF